MFQDLWNQELSSSVECSVCRRWIDLSALLVYVFAVCSVCGESKDRYSVRREEHTLPGSVFHADFVYWSIRLTNSCDGIDLDGLKLSLEIDGGVMYCVR